MSLGLVLVLLEMMEERGDGVVVVSFVDVVVDDDDDDDVVCCANLCSSLHITHIACIPFQLPSLRTSPLREIISNQLLLLHRYYYPNSSIPAYLDNYPPNQPTR